MKDFEYNKFLYLLDDPTGPTRAIDYILKCEVLKLDHRFDLYNDYYLIVKYNKDVRSLLICWKNKAETQHVFGLCDKDINVAIVSILSDIQYDTLNKYDFPTRLV